MGSRIANEDLNGAPVPSLATPEDLAAALGTVLAGTNLGPDDTNTDDDLTDEVAEPRRAIRLLRR